jgi:hypothetical protein
MTNVVQRDCLKEQTPRSQFNDGGRSEVGFPGETGDCVCRAIATATDKPYLEVYEELTALGWNCWEPWNPCYHHSTKDYWLKHSCYCDPDTDTYLYEEDFRQDCNWREPADGSHIWPEESRWRTDNYLKSLGWQWTEANEVHLRADELPAGRLIVAIPEHLVAVIDGVIHDTFDCFRGGTCCVKGWWGVGEPERTFQQSMQS